MYNYHRYNLTVSPEGLLTCKGSRFLVPDALGTGLLRSLHTGHAGIVSMIIRAKEAFWWPGLKQAIENKRANCLVCHENAPSNPKQPSMEVFKTKYAYEALAMDHFFLRGVEYLDIADIHIAMLSVHCTKHRGANEVIKILSVHCQCQVAWTKKSNLGIYGSLMVANDVSIPRECFPKISELLKRNWLRAPHI